MPQSKAYCHRSFPKKQSGISRQPLSGVPIPEECHWIPRNQKHPDKSRTQVSSGLRDTKSNKVKPLASPALTTAANPRCLKLPATRFTPKLCL